MSIRSLTSLAVERDRANPGAAVPGGGGPPAPVPAAVVAAPGAPAAAAPAVPQVPQRFVDVLISAIPTEPLAAYTALVGVAVGAIDIAHPRAYLPFRWWCYIGFLVLTVLAVGISYLRAFPAPSTGAPPPPKSTKRLFPWAEGGAALIAAAAWGLAMPGSALNVQLTGTARTLAVATIVVLAASVLSLLFAPQLKTGTSKT